jgi:plastocyanin
MRSALKTLMAGVAVSFLLSASAAAQATHVVRLIADPTKDDYRFDPADVTVSAGDMVVFRVASGAPHSVVFEGEGLSPAVHGAINAAIPNRSGDLSSPLLTAPGKDLRFVVPQLPAGSYRFYCLPHRAYDMRGALTVR